MTEKVKKIHFTGVLGASTSALAKHLKLSGYSVSGTDSDADGDFKSLWDLGIDARYKHCARRVKGADVLIYTSAVNCSNPELKYAKRKKIPAYKRSQLLGQIAGEFKTSVAISGSHGKTTTTAMIADMLICAHKEPTVFLGGESVEYGNYFKGGDEFVVLEACEYQKNFLDIKPKISVVLNVDNDHQDSFSGIADAVQTFNAFIENSVAVINADDDNARKLESSTAITFGINSNAVITAKNVKKNGVGYKFTACAYGRKLGEINLQILGKHNVYNALATIGVAEILKIPFQQVKSALESFKGVKRRAEFIGKIGNADCFADYAHHPNEIFATLKAYSENLDDFAVIFQPHTYSRTKFLMQEFCQALKDCKCLTLFKTYAAREAVDESASEKALYARLKECSRARLYICENEMELEKVSLNLAENYRALVFLGAGDVYRIAKNIIKKIKFKYLKNCPKKD